MNPQIVADGGARLHSSAEFQLAREKLRREIEERYAEALAKAGLFRHLLLRWKIAAEFRRACRKIEPSPKSLYGKVKT